MKQNSINKISKKKIKNESHEIKEFIQDLKNAGATLGQTMEILVKKIDVVTPKAFFIIQDSGIWPELNSNPSNDEFFEIINKQK